MERKSGVKKRASLDKKRAREGIDGATTEVAAAADAVVESAGVPLPVNGAPEIVERTVVKRAKIDVAAGGSHLAVEEKRKVVQRTEVTRTTEVKRTKIDLAAGESVMAMEVERKVVESVSIDTVVTKDDSGAKDAVADESKKVKDAVADESKKVKDAVADESKKVKDAVADESKKVKDAVADEPKKVKDAVVDEPKKVKDAVADESKKVKDAVADESKKVKDAVADESKKVKDAVADEPKKVKDAVVDEPKKVKDAVADESKKVKDAVADESKKVKDAVADEPKKVKDAVVDEPKKVKDAVADETKNVKDAVVEEIKKVKNTPGGGKEGKKRKVAMLLAYCGAGYQGMQRNPEAITIEGELEQALFRASAIAQCNFGDMRKVDWMRAARTDKGVSAIGQIVSARLVIDPPGFVERVNQHLPKDIRVFGFTRVTSSFNAKQMCDKRRYEYLVPVFAFDPHAHHDRDTMLMWTERKENVRLQRIEKRKALEQNGAGSKAGAKDVISEASQPKASEVEVVVTTIVEQVVEPEVEETPDEEEREPFVFDDAKLQRLNDVLSGYKGTHNFHNFTARIKPEDPSAKRYILSFEAGKVVEVQGTQFVPCTVVGQSFMLHQIRKMIGTAIAVMRGCVPETIIDFALKRENDVNTPMAPELGLFLDECYYTAYNKRFGRSHEELTQKGYEDKIQTFKHEVIYPHIATTEAKDGTMALWLHSLNDRHYPYFETHRAAAQN